MAVLLEQGPRSRLIKITTSSLFPTRQTNQGAGTPSLEETKCLGYWFFLEKRGGGTEGGWDGGALHLHVIPKADITVLLHPPPAFRKGLLFFTRNEFMEVTAPRHDKDRQLLA